MTDERPAAAGVAGRRWSGFTLALGAITLVALGLRIWSLTGQSLWENEGYTLGLAQRPFGDMLSLLKIEGNGILYPLVYWPLERIDDGLALLRAPALVAGTLAVPALYWAGRKLVGARAALIGAALLAVNPLAVYFSQEARAYIFVALFASLSFGCLVNALERDGRRWWALYVLATAALVYSHSLGVLLVLPQAFLVLPRGRRALQAWALSGAATAVLLIPQIYLLLADAGRRDALYFLVRPGPKDALLLVRAFGVGQTNSNPAFAVFALAAAAALVGAAVLARRHWPARGRLWRHPLTVVAAWAVVPIVAALAISLVKPLIAGGIPQYVIGALPGFCLLIGVALAHLPRVPAAVTALVIAAVFLGSVAWQTDHVTKEDWRAAAPWLVAHRGAGDPVLIDSIIKLPALGYYARSFRAPNGDLVVKEWHDTPLPRDVTGLTDPGGYGDAPPGPPGIALVRRLVRRTGRVLVVIADPTGQGHIEDETGLAWARRHCALRRRDFPAQGGAGNDIEILALSACRGA